MGLSERREGGGADALLKLARHHLGMRDHVYYAPSIPPAKEAAARGVHGAHLPESEAVLALYDATAFGGAKEGLVITAARICWKNRFEHPRQIPWGEVDPATVAVEEGRFVGIAHGRIDLREEVAEGVARFLVEAARVAGAREASPYREAAGASAGTAEGAALRVAQLTALARRHLGEVDDVFYHPAIPAAKLEQARAVHAAFLGEGDTVAVLFDATAFGSAKDGFVMTTDRFCWKNIADEARAVPWDGLDPDAVAAQGNQVEIMAGKVELGSRGELAGPLAALLVATFAWAHGDGGI